MRTYLAIDLDYWNGLPRQSINAFFARVFRLRLPIWVAPFHHQLLPHINQNPCDQLINVDYHSDICECGDLPLNEGTWGNFVKWRKHSTFIWRYPDQRCLSRGTGYCHSDKNPFEDATCTDWRCLKQEGLRNLPWSTVKAVGVSLSWNWIEGSNPCVPITKILGIARWLEWTSTEQEEQARPFLWPLASGPLHSSTWRRGARSLSPNSLVFNRSLRPSSCLDSHCTR